MYLSMSFFLDSFRTFVIYYVVISLFLPVFRYLFISFDVFVIGRLLLLLLRRRRRRNKKKKRKKSEKEKEKDNGRAGHEDTEDNNDIYKTEKESENMVVVASAF